MIRCLEQWITPASGGDKVSVLPHSSCELTPFPELSWGAGGPIAQWWLCSLLPSLEWSGFLFRFPPLFSIMRHWRWANESKNSPSLYIWGVVLLVVVLPKLQASGRAKNWPSKISKKERKNSKAVWRRDLTGRWSTGVLAVKAVFFICTDGLPAILLNAMFTACFSDVWLQNWYPTLLIFRLCLADWWRSTLQHLGDLSSCVWGTESLKSGPVPMVTTGSEWTLVF